MENKIILSAIDCILFIIPNFQWAHSFPHPTPRLLHSALAKSHMELYFQELSFLAEECKLVFNHILGTKEILFCLLRHNKSYMHLNQNIEYMIANIFLDILSVNTIIKKISSHLHIDHVHPDNPPPPKKTN